MTTSEYNTALYHKLYAEQERYRDWLLSQPPEEILNHCYECTVRQDILFALEENDLSAEQCKALLKLENPVADIFKDFEKRESDYMADISNIKNLFYISRTDTSACRVLCSTRQK